MLRSILVYTCSLFDCIPLRFVHVCVCICCAACACPLRYSLSWWPSAVTWHCSAPYYSNLEYYCHWPFQRRWPDVKPQVVCDEWHSFGVVDSKGIRHGQSPLTSASCWRWQTRLGFLSMPGILFTLSFLEFWKASEPPTQNRLAERHTKLRGYSVCSKLSSPSAVCLVIQFRCAGSKNMFAWMKSTPPPTLTKDCALLSGVPSWTTKRGTATTASLASKPLNRQTSLLCTVSATFCCFFSSSCYYVHSALTPALSVVTC